MNREQGYQLPPIYHQLLLTEQFPAKKIAGVETSWSFTKRSKVSENIHISSVHLFRETKVKCVASLFMLWNPQQK